MVDAAKIVRSPIVRAVLGSSADRRGGIEKHIDSMVAVLKNSRSKVMDAGVKVAIENHAGDMQARELKGLVEAAGPDFVGVCIDSGNPVWTIEDPHLTLETLAPVRADEPHARQRALEHARRRRRAMDADGRRQHGHGRLHPHLHRRSARARPCRSRSSSAATRGCSTTAIRQFWELFKSTPAWEFARFLTLCDKGKPTPAAPPDPAMTPQARNLADVEASVKWTQAFLAKLLDGTKPGSWESTPEAALPDVWSDRRRRRRTAACRSLHRRRHATRRSRPPTSCSCATTRADITVSVMTSVSNAYEMVVKGQNVIRMPFATVDDFRARPGLNGIPLLAPFANRLDEQAFYANGKKYNFDMELGNVRGTIPIHGFLSGAKDWKLVEAKADGKSAWVTSRWTSIAIRSGCSSFLSRTCWR